jgi:hypothetical protein
VLVHLLPGLALYAHRYHPSPRGVRGLARLAYALLTHPRQAARAFSPPPPTSLDPVYTPSPSLAPSSTSSALSSSVLSTMGLLGGTAGGGGQGAVAGKGPFLARTGDPGATATWLILVPLLFYLTWQLVYWFLVQVVFIRLFQSDKAYETSYKWLARRGRNSDSPLAKFVCRGEKPPQRALTLPRFFSFW